MPTIQKDQVRTAFNNWHTANQLNCSKVQFLEGVAPNGFGYATVIVENVQIGESDYYSEGGRPAYFDTTNGTIGTEVVNARMYFHPRLKFSPSDPRLIYDPNLPDTYATIFVKEAMHEIGHGMGLTHYTESHPNPCTEQSAGSSVMNDACGINDSENSMSTDVKSCDTARINAIYICPTPTPTPRPQPTYYPPPSSCYNPIDNFIGNACPMGFAADPGGGYCCQTEMPFPTPTQCPDPPPTYSCDGPLPENGCPYYIDQDPCWSSPVVIDVLGNGFNLTNAATGVDFDIDGNPDNIRERISWTATNSDDAWLVLDHNGNSRIDSGRELFGNFTPQPAPPEGESRNGFLALAEYDKTERGGNADQVIDSRDFVFASLRLWQDTNHNGVSETSELKTLGELGLTTLELDYKESKRTDEHGNQFRYRAKVKDVNGAQVKRWAWDVFLTTR